MYFEQFYLTCLAHASYMIGSQGEAAVIDPQRDVDLYLEAADEQGLKIRHIFETHLHADFVSGHKELAARTGATIYIGVEAHAGFPHSALKDGSEIRMGTVLVRALETPGHTPESVCLVITEEKSSEPWGVLTGDTLFIGDVGRPDLSPHHTPQQLAGLLYDSLHAKLLRLPDSTLVYPAHGAGSLCGRNMRAERSSTIGTERLTNYALQIKSREEFIRQVTANLPARPGYFLQDAEINRSGAEPLIGRPLLAEFTPEQVQGSLNRKANIVDVRPPEQFAVEHIAGSINIALSGQFATWAGTILGLASKPVLVAETDAQIEEANLRLSRVGIEDVQGYLGGGIEAWKKAGFPLVATAQILAQGLHEQLQDGSVRVLDVRRDGEWQAGHIAQAQNWALDIFPQGLPDLNMAQPLAVHCKGGYRSMIACSLLERAGHSNVINLVGGFDAWQAAGLPEVSGQLAKV
jgi:glyoxylase-like metal-dependent hydrolase (beta-lactamase superfamily II)/rhodanese-related sulfurtransferase